MHSSHHHGVRVFEKLKDKSCNAQNRRYVEMTNHLFDTYNFFVFPHVNHMFKT